MCFMTPGVTSTIVSGRRISELESLLDSQVIFQCHWKIVFILSRILGWLTNVMFMQIYATENRAELEESVPSAKVVRRF